eukprot:TRINITY_DN27973_c1_g4_i1.p1 TRINITY_DN27973_c1_g4~~TRINITY_DN27973_c1_g4_i1.p1  ORF type:complete len:420 (-),score=24.96 TRINITY_DN27973_c1_g4_i1:281-1441(-)
MSTGKPRTSPSVLALDPAVFGGTIDESVVRKAKVAYTDTKALKLRRRACIIWQEGRPSSALLVKKAGNQRATEVLLEVGDWLKGQGIQVFVEEAVNEQLQNRFTSFRLEDNVVDFCITLGGDGTVLHLASLFTRDRPLPPVISFSMGTLGFLTPFDVNDYKYHIRRVIDANTAEQQVFCTLRTRKRCEVFEQVSGNHFQCREHHHVLNECVIDRGVATSMVWLDCFVDGEFVTNVQADGLIISTPSGSTAYSMSAGGPMVAPSVPGTIITPIAPHSLSFRPLVIPESSDLVIHISDSNKLPARISFDGRHTIEVVPGSTLQFKTSLCPLPMINLSRFDKDWYEGITQKLKWNLNIRSVEMPRLISKTKDNGNGCQSLLSNSVHSKM